MNKHFCPDWDFLEIKEDDPEMDCCTCRRVHKETFSQAAYQGIPAHWVVQYYDQDGLQAAYFSNVEEAEEFEREVKND